jgi:hypothetical protein
MVGAITIRNILIFESVSVDHQAIILVVEVNYLIDDHPL